MNGLRWPGRRNVVPETPTQFAERLARVHADPQLRHTSETPSAAPEPAGEAGVDEEAQADAVAAMEALRARVAKSRRVLSPPTEATSAGNVDLGALVREQVQRELGRLARERADRERLVAEANARAEWQERERLARGGPCRCCGLVLSWERGDDGEPVGVWYDGDCCTWCNTDRKLFAGPGGVLTELEHRAEVLRKYILPESVTRYWYNEGLLKKAAAFRWWKAMPPGAPTTEDPDERFPHVDRLALAKAFEPEPIRYETREPCPRCGCPSRWLWARSYQPAGSGQVAVETWLCTGCRDTRDLVALISRTTGLTPWKVETLGAAAAEVFGVHWWSDSPTGGRATPPQPCATAFAYIDQAAARRAAWRLFQAVRDYGYPAAWQAAREAAGA